MVTASPHATDTAIRTEKLFSSAGEPDSNAAASSDVSERKCLVLGTVRPKEELIRFVLGPEKRVVPDVAERLPGRGLWVSANREALEEAVAKKLFPRAAKTAAQVSPDLPELVEHLLEKRCLDLLGLARSSGLVVMGQAQVEQSIKNKELFFILTALDAGGAGLKKCAQPEISTLFGPSREKLGAALGRENPVYLGLKPHSLTKKLRLELLRWQGVAKKTMTLTQKEQE